MLLYINHCVCTLSAKHLQLGTDIEESMTKSVKEQYGEYQSTTATTAWDEMQYTVITTCVFTSMHKLFIAMSMQNRLQSAKLYA